MITVSLKEAKKMGKKGEKIAVILKSVMANIHKENAKTAKTAKEVGKVCDDLVKKMR